MSFATHPQTSNTHTQPQPTSSLHSPNVNPPSMQHPLPPNLLTSSSSSTPITELNNGPWFNYSYPSKWEISDDFMCVHFIPKTSDTATWKSQCIFWNEAISLYAQQLLYKCPYKYNRLTFTSLDIQRAYTRINRLKPMCIIDIIKWMKSAKNNILFVTYLEENYNIKPTPNNIENTASNTSLLSIPTISSMVSSMFEYLLPTAVVNSSDDECDILDYAMDNKTNINDNTAVIYTPVMDEFCERMSDLNFYQKTCSQNRDLCELLSIGSIALQNGAFVINGLVFYRFCMEVLNLTVSDVLIMKKYLIFVGKVKLFYLNDTNSMNFNENIDSKSSFHDLKNEMIYFNFNANTFEVELQQQEILNKMQLLSINLTMKHLKFQKSENENNLNHLNEKILFKLKKVCGVKKRKQFLHENVLLFEKKKLLKKRISCIDGSIYNLETTLHSMQDLNLNKMVFIEMKNADKILKDILKSTPSIAEIKDMQEDIKESIEVNEEIGDVLSQPVGVNGMDTDDNDGFDEELLKEYEDLEMENIKNELVDVPTHDVVIKDNVGSVVDDSDDGDVVVEKEKQVLVN